MAICAHTSYTGKFQGKGQRIFTSPGKGEVGGDANEEFESKIRIPKP